MKKRFTILTLVMITIMLMPVAFGQFTFPTGSTDADIPRSNVRVTFLSQDPDPVEPGEILEVKLKVENYGGRTIENIDFEVMPEYPFTLVSGEKSVKNIGSLDARQVGDDSVIIKWKLKVSEDAVEGEKELDFSYKVGNVYIKVGPYPITIKSRDIFVNVEQINITPERAKPGEEIIVNVKLKNLADSEVTEVKVNLDLEETDLTAIGSASKKVVRKLSPGEVKDIKFNLIADADATSKVHKIPFKLEFIDKFGDAHSLDTIFGCIIESPPEYILNMEETDIFKKDQSGKVTLSVSNVGNSDINFVTLEILPSEDYEVITTPLIYLGNLESDDYETAEYIVYTKKVKKDIIPIKTKVSFKDSFNNDYSKEMELPLHIYSSSDAKKYGLVEQTSSFGWIILLVIIGGVGYYIYRKKYSRDAKEKKK